MAKLVSKDGLSDDDYRRLLHAVLAIARADNGMSPKDRAEAVCVASEDAGVPSQGEDGAGATLLVIDPYSHRWNILVWRESKEKPYSYFEDRIVPSVVYETFGLDVPEEVREFEQRVIPYSAKPLSADG